MWPIEIIKDESFIFSRIHKDFISKTDNLPKAAAFSNTPKDGNNLSCDWDKYCTPKDARDLIGLQKKKDGTFKNKDLFFIWKMKAYNIRNNLVPKQIVKHDPLYNNPELEGLPNNRAHSIIIGDKEINNAEFRISFLRNGEWAIGPSEAIEIF